MGHRPSPPNSKRRNDDCWWEVHPETNSRSLSLECLALWWRHLGIRCKDISAEHRTNNGSGTCSPSDSVGVGRPLVNDGFLFQLLHGSTISLFVFSSDPSLHHHDVTLVCTCCTVSDHIAPDEISHAQDILPCIASKKVSNASAYPLRHSPQLSTPAGRSELQTEATHWMEHRETASSWANPPSR